MSDLKVTDMLAHLESRNREPRPGYELVHIAYAGIFPAGEDREWFLAQPFFVERPANTREGHDAWERDLREAQARALANAESVLPEAAFTEGEEAQNRRSEEPAPAGLTRIERHDGDGGQDNHGDDDGGQGAGGNRTFRINWV